jgi:hypothetical protein
MSEEQGPKRAIELISWPVVALFLIGCATVFALVFWGHQELNTISAFVGALGTIVVAVYLRQVSKDTNGNLSKRDLQIEELQRRLDALHTVRASETAQFAQQIPPTASLPPTLAPEPRATASDAFNATTVQVPTVQRT